MVGGDFQKPLHLLMDIARLKTTSALTHRTPLVGGLPTPL